MFQASQGTCCRNTKGEIGEEDKYRVGVGRKPTLGRNTNGNRRAGKLLPCEYKYKFAPIPKYKYRVGGGRTPTLRRKTNGNGRAGKLLPCEYKYKFTPIPKYKYRLGGEESQLWEGIQMEIGEHESSFLANTNTNDK